MNQPERKGFPWLPASFMLGGVLAFYLWLTGERVEPFVDAGYALGTTLIVWIVMLLAGLHRAGAAGMAGALAVMWVMAFGGLMAGGKMPSVGEESGPRFTDQLERVQEDLLNDSLAPIKEMESGVVAPGERGQAQLLLTRVLNEMVAVQNEYMAELRVIGWESILDAERLDGDRGMVETRRMLSRAKETATRMCEGYRARLVAAAEQSATELRLSAAQRKEVIDGLIGGLEKNSGVTTELCDLELKTIDEFAALASVFERDSGWERDQEMYLFTEDHFVEEFNRRLAAIDAISERQESLRRATMADATENLRGLGL